MNNISKTTLPTASEGTPRLLHAASLPMEELLQEYGVTLQGHSPARVEELRELYGANKITKQKGDSIFKRLFDSFVNPFTIVLFVLAGISLLTDVLLAPAGQKDPWSVIIILIMVFISGILRFVQESRSGDAAEKLSEMVENTIAVQRSGQVVTEIPNDEVVVGDIIILSAGDMIPADMRILQMKDFFVGQSSLTGESEPIEKFAVSVDIQGKNPLELNNLVFMGSTVLTGNATAIVVNVGDNTVFGSIAHQLTEKKPLTSFEKGINEVSWVLIRFMMVMVPLVFFLNGFRGTGWMQAFLFALSIAVGLTPAMLPTLVAAGLAKGAVTLSKQKVIVKDLNSIQNFGAMDVLCTDKTGTLTQDKVVLIHSLDIHGNEDKRVLRHAFLNSYHQTGLKNLMDIAIIEFAEEHEDLTGWKNYTKVDEVPFDFSRRRLSVLVEDDTQKLQMITKGAIEEMLEVSTFAEYHGKVEPIDDALRDKILKKVQSYNNQGMRVLGVAQRTNPADVGVFSVEDEVDMVLIGYLAFLDPPKESTAAAIAALHEHGVEVKILTGDNDGVAVAICEQVNLPVERVLLGADLEYLDDDQLDEISSSVSVFAKLSPQQKARVIDSLRRCGHTIGYMGDGINDALAMKQSDVGISVDTAVDIAKESADIILLEKDLMVLEQGILEGRRTYANIIKYIKMTVSSNFGNMFSVLAASAFLPFLPMLPVQLLVLNLIYDIACIALPWDNVDEDFLKIPRKWEASSLSRFMIWLGPISSIFDITTYLALFFFICPAVCGGAYHTLTPAMQALFIMVFHSGWFVESLWSQTLVIHLLRTPHVPFIQSRASTRLMIGTALGILAGTLLPYTPIGVVLDMAVLPFSFYLLLVGTVILYVLFTTLIKNLYIKKYQEFL